MISNNIKKINFKLNITLNTHFARKKHLIAFKSTLKIEIEVKSEIRKKQGMIELMDCVVV